MNVASDAPSRPALRYYGGKWKLAPWIISHFPPHKNYVEPCGGAASVLLQKPRSPLETYNDLDGNVVNFFRVLRDRLDELIWAIRLTPWARAEYELSFEPTDDDLERARRFFVQSWMSMQGATDPTVKGTWRVMRDNSEGSNTGAYDLRSIPVALAQIASRLKLVQIENQDWIEVTKRFDGPNTLIYFDPPYVKRERSSTMCYNYEWADTQHTEAAALLRECAGYVIVSGYACDLYAELYEAHGWQRVDKEAQTNSGGKRIESLWLSPRTWAALSGDLNDLPLFS